MWRPRLELRTAEKHVKNSIFRTNLLSVYQCTFQTCRRNTYPRWALVYISEDELYQ